MIGIQRLLYQAVNVESHPANDDMVHTLLVQSCDHPEGVVERIHERPSHHEGSKSADAVRGSRITDLLKR